MPIVWPVFRQFYCPGCGAPSDYADFFRRNENAMQARPSRASVPGSGTRVGIAPAFTIKSIPLPPTSRIFPLVLNRLNVLEKLQSISQKLIV